MKKIETAWSMTTAQSELENFRTGISQVLDMIKPLSEGEPVDNSHLTSISSEQADGHTENKHVLRYLSEDIHN